MKGLYIHYLFSLFIAVKCQSDKTESQPDTKLPNYKNKDIYINVSASKDTDQNNQVLENLFGINANNVNGNIKPASYKTGLDGNYAESQPYSVDFDIQDYLIGTQVDSDSPNNKGQSYYSDNDQDYPDMYSSEVYTPTRAQPSRMVTVTTTKFITSTIKRPFRYTDPLNYFDQDSGPRDDYVPLKIPSKPVMQCFYAKPSNSHLKGTTANVFHNPPANPNSPPQMYAVSQFDRNRDLLVSSMFSRFGTFQICLVSSPSSWESQYPPLPNHKHETFQNCPLLYIVFGPYKPDNYPPKTARPAFRPPYEPYTSLLQNAPSYQDNIQNYGLEYTQYTSPTPTGRADYYQQDSSAYSSAGYIDVPYSPTRLDITRPNMDKYTDDRPIYRDSVSNDYTPIYPTITPTYTTERLNYEYTSQGYPSTNLYYSTSLPVYPSTNFYYSTSYQGYSSEYPSYTPTYQTYTTAYSEYMPIYSSYTTPSQYYSEYSTRVPIYQTPNSPYQDYSFAYPTYAPPYQAYTTGYPDYITSTQGYYSEYPGYSTSPQGYYSAYPTYAPSYQAYTTGYPDYSTSTQGYYSANSDYSTPVPKYRPYPSITSFDF
ncbi:hypothetical protein AYI68_g2481 [Smittium mucronatum]|uniref:Uncharacterized protein n=1 Tax=Smittium mucronatum TaxID=133383 RepID=A0A1R0H2P8_9FUNG|nr:hypothetical protein AYI68_g2481 [Smittium mucronatum]